MSLYLSGSGRHFYQPFKLTFTLRLLATFLFLCPSVPRALNRQCDDKLCLLTFSFSFSSLVTVLVPREVTTTSGRSGTEPPTSPSNGPVLNRQLAGDLNRAKSRGCFISGHTLRFVLLFQAASKCQVTTFPVSATIPGQRHHYLHLSPGVGKAEGRVTVPPCGLSLAVPPITSMLS